MVKILRDSLAKSARQSIYLSVLLTLMLASAAAQELPPSVTVVSPIYGQLVAHSQPSTFTPVFENAGAENYIRESVPKGETTQKWSQMITVSGFKGLAEMPNVTPARYTDTFAGLIKKACPTTFSALSISDAKIGGYDAFVAVTSCGTTNFGGTAHAETVLIVTIKGKSDLYTIQWAERGKASAKPLKIDTTTWARRLKELGPIRLCSKVPGEKPPYPSCVEEK